MIVTVSTSAGLTNALRTAHGGDTIQLAAGTYDAVTLKANFSSAVTITSQNPDAPAVFTGGLQVLSSSGLNISNVEAVVGSGGYAVTVNGGTNVNLSGLDIHGSLNNNPVGDGNGLLLRNSTNVSVTDSQFHDLVMGLAQLNNTHMTLDNNDFEYIQTDGIRGGGSSYVEISGNTFTNFARLPGDHADAIQFWTTNTTTSAHDIAITNNTFVRGDGTTVQGIFLRDEVGNLPYQNVTITGNAIVGGEYNGITVIGGKGVNISDNLVAGYSDMSSYIRVESSTKAVVSNNQTDSLHLTNSTDTIVQTANKIIPLFGVGDTSALTQWEANHSATLIPAPIAEAAKAAAITTVGGVDLRAAALIVSPLDPAATHSITGGAKNDVVTGTAGNDYIDGGTGIDTMTGGAGNDTYVVDHPRDVVIEGANGGIDTVVTKYSTLALMNNVENLVLNATGLQRGTGNALDNVIVSNSVRSVLSGGDGNDTLVAVGGQTTLTGGTGHDVFRFESLPSKTDQITDFTPGTDVLNLHDLLASYHGTDPVADGWVKFAYSSTGVTVSVDLDGPTGHSGFMPVATLVGVSASSLHAGTDWVF